MIGEHPGLMGQAVQRCLCMGLLIILFSCQMTQVDEPPGAMYAEVGASDLVDGATDVLDVSDLVALDGEMGSGGTLPLIHPIDSLILTENPANVLSFYAAWQTLEPSPSHLTVDCGQDYLAHFSDSEPKEAHNAFIMGLWEGATCRVTVTADPYQMTQVYEVSDLPGDFLPQVTLVEGKFSNVAPGWTLLNLSNQGEDRPLKVAVIDEYGRYRWYHSLGDANSGSDTQVTVVEGGVLIGGTVHPFVSPSLVNWEGQVLWEGDFSMHHDLQLDLDAGELLFISGTDGDECEGGEGQQNINRYDWEEQVITWSWWLCHHYLPDAIVEDWAHLNSIVFFSEDELLISSRNQDALFLMNRETEELVWTMGQAGGFSLVQPTESSPDPSFYHQHAPEIQPDGNILIFDNGKAGTREFSRAVELAYDLETMEAWAVWEYVPEPAIFTPIWGDADRLENGNTLLTFGSRDLDQETRIEEVSAEGEPVWIVTFPVGWGSYRADREAEIPLGWIAIGQDD